MSDVVRGANESSPVVAAAAINKITVATQYNNYANSNINSNFLGKKKFNSKLMYTN